MLVWTNEKQLKHLILHKIFKKRSYFLLLREAFLSSGDIASYQTVSDNMVAALPLLSDSIQTDVFSLTLPVPPPLETKGCQVGFGPILSEVILSALNVRKRLST